MPPLNEELWYFAYGANMAAAKLQVRGIYPRHSQRAVVADWALRFNHPGAPPLEPVFASIEPAPGQVVHGVAHVISAQEAAALDQFEGGYRRIPVPMRLDDGSTLPGYAYQTLSPGPEGVPSARYLYLLLDGAYAHDLPAAWIAALEAQLTTAHQRNHGVGGHGREARLNRRVFHGGQHAAGPRGGA